MKKLLKTIYCLILTLVLSTPTVALCADTVPIEDVPYITEIEFNGATIYGGFNENSTEFQLILDDESVTPSLKSYEIEGTANLYVNYVYNDQNQQTGITVTLSFENGSVIYTFDYKNLTDPVITSNANLSGISCNLGELSPEFDSGTTSYKLYIPSDLTELTVTPVTEDVNAYAATVTLELREEQETEFNITVTASDGTTKTYKIKVRRVEKTTAEVIAEMSEEGYTSFVEGELFYQQPMFLIVVASVVGGIIIIAVLIALTKRFMVNAYDSEEAEFYLTEPLQETENDT